jgi:hypothetical protein
MFLQQRELAEYDKLWREQETEDLWMNLDEYNSIHDQLFLSLDFSLFLRLCFSFLFLIFHNNEL